MLTNMGREQNGLPTPLRWSNTDVGLLQCAIACEIQQQVDRLMQDPVTLHRLVRLSLGLPDQIEAD
jgi:hypothetical protein